MAESIVTLRVEARNAIASLNKTSLAAKGLSVSAKSSTGALAATSAAAKGLGATLMTTMAPVIAIGTAFATVNSAMKTFSDRQRDVAILKQGLVNLGEGTATLNSLQEAASKLGDQTLFNQEEFTRGFNLLTSFRKIGVDSYERVAQAAADIAQVNQVDVKTSFMQLAKALQDPERNLSALNRSGIAFTETQTEMIKELMKSGKTAEAHAMILSIVEGSYNKLSQAAATGLAGEVDTLGESFRDFSETLGKALTPVMIEVTKGLSALLRGIDNLLKSPFASFVSNQLQKGFQALVAVGKQFGFVMKEAFGADVTKALAKLEKGFIAIGELIKHVTKDAEFIGRVVGGVIGVTIRNFITLRQQIRDTFIESTQPVVNFFEGISKSVVQITKTLVQGFRNAFQRLIDLIPEPIKKLLGGIELPKFNLDIALPKFENPFKKLKEGVDKLIPAVIEYSEVERTITDENNKQLDAKNKIVATVPNIKKGVEELTEAEKRAKEEAEKLKETFKGIGESVRNDLVSNLTDAITGAKSFGDAMKNVLGNLKKQLIQLALNKAISKIGSSLSGGKGFGGGFLSGLFGRARGGPVSAGGAYVVGEKGPEILQMGSKGGNVIPNNKLSGGDSVTNVITVNVDASGSAVSGSSVEGNQLGQQLAGAIQAELIKQKRAGGLLA